MEEQTPMEKRLKGYKTVVTVLGVLLLAMTITLMLTTRKNRDAKSILTEQRDTLANRLSGMIDGFDLLQTENDTINAQLTVERGRADSLLDRLRQERNWNAAKIRQYESQLGTLRLVMQGYVRQIDSLNTLAANLQRDNIAIRREVNTERMRADMAEERAQELDVKVQRGAVILASNIRLRALNNRDSEVSRAGRAARLSTDLVLVANELAEPGERTVYVRIVGPDGYVLANESNATIEIDGERITYSASRPVDYDNKNLDVNVYYNGGGIVAGKYAVTVYLDGRLAGSNEIVLR